MRDGRNSFFKQLDPDKKFQQLLRAFQEIKIKMLNERDGDYYSPGKVYKD